MNAERPSEVEAELTELSILIHAKGWPDPVTLPLDPRCCQVCDDAIRTARAVLASDWLAERDAQVRAEAWDEGYEQAGHDMGPYQYRETENPYRSNP